MMSQSFLFQRNFVDPLEHEIHTQGIGRAWAQAKYDLMRLNRGKSPALLPGYFQASGGIPWTGAESGPSAESWT